MLVEYLPTKVVLWLAGPYLAGWDSNQAISTAQKIWRENNFAGTLDVLGEQASTNEQCEYYVRTYFDLIEQLTKYPLPVTTPRYQLTISFKPSMFCVAPFPDKLPEPQNLDEAFVRITKVVDYASKHSLQMTLEAESHLWTDFHLDSYFALLAAGYNNLGTVLQTRLFRTRKDIQRFDQRTRVRLVTGIYTESAEIAHTNNKPMKEALISFSRELLSKGAYVELASHDQAYIHKFFSDVVLPLEVPAEQFETQFLLGVPRLQLQQGLASGEYFRSWDKSNLGASTRALLEQLATSGTLVRLYLPFGSGEVAAPYCKRRLQHNPNLILYGIKNILHIQT